MSSAPVACRGARARAFGAALSVAALLAAACSGAVSDGQSGPVGVNATAAGVAALELPQGDDPVDLDPATFSTDIDNPYWPMQPGTRWTYSEVDSDGSQLTVVRVVTTQTKLIANGITARVVRDTVREGEGTDGAIVEDTFDWFAQAQDGTVWYLGEDTAEFENGAISSTKGSFEAGVDGALPGVIMPGDPQPGMVYRQEYYQGEAEDNGAILSTQELAEVPFGQFTDVVLTRETITIEPDVQEYKLYARGVGPVLAVGVSGGSSRLELLRVDQAPATAGTGPLGTPDA